MADANTEAKWEKSKQIEVERMKAAKSLNERKPDKSGLAFLDPSSTKVKGWSNDKNVIIASTERMGNRAIILAVSGATLGVIGLVGSTVSTVFRLGMAGAMVSGLPSGIGYLCMGVAIVMAIVVIIGELYTKIKHGCKTSASLWSALGAIGVVILYFVAQWLIIRFS